MAYERQTWIDYPDESTPISSERLTHIENGIYNASVLLDSVVEELDDVKYRKLVLSNGSFGNNDLITYYASNAYNAYAADTEVTSGRSYKYIELTLPEAVSFEDIHSITFRNNAGTAVTYEYTKLTSDETVFASHNTSGTSLDFNWRCKYTNIDGTNSRSILIARKDLKLYITDTVIDGESNHLVDLLHRLCVENDDLSNFTVTIKVPRFTS